MAQVIPTVTAMWSVMRITVAAMAAMVTTVTKVTTMVTMLVMVDMDSLQDMDMVHPRNSDITRRSAASVL
eukprot:Skav226559  [mRNA]  locus=scaffold1427:182353:189451:+ [translate_table: standard]